MQKKSSCKSVMTGSVELLRQRRDETVFMLVLATALILWPWLAYAGSLARLIYNPFIVDI